MKVGIATTLSIVGVLAAGAAAFAVNTSVLGSANAPATTSVSDSGILSPVDTTIPGSINALNTAVVEQKPSSTTRTYAVGNSGTVVIDTSSGSVVVTSIAPAAGWTSEPAHIDAKGSVKVHFVQGANRIEFTVQMVNGAVQTVVKNETASVANTTKPSVPPFAGGDGDDDDGHEGDNHEQDDD
jgi:hypothetical protein